MNTHTKILKALAIESSNIKKKIIHHNLCRSISVIQIINDYLWILDYGQFFSSKFSITNTAQSFNKNLKLLFKRNTKNFLPIFPGVDRKKYWFGLKIHKEKNVSHSLQSKRWNESIKQQQQKIVNSKCDKMSPPLSRKQAGVKQESSVRTRGFSCPSPAEEPPSLHDGASAGGHESRSVVRLWHSAPICHVT